MHFTWSTVSSMHVPRWSRETILGHLTATATVCPLIAAIIAPLSVLLDIPALTETWYRSNGSPAPDPVASLVLSGLSLAFCLLASALLLLRFSVYEAYWRIATHVSVACWLVKVAVGLTNLIVFGLLSRNEPQYSYDEGFYCGLMSLLTAFIVVLLLVVHWIVQFMPLGDAYSARVRRHGRHFMSHNLFFISIIGLTALVISKIEGWSYLQGIYFSVVTFETVGFGSDFAPTQVASRILVFPFALIGIAQLSVLIQLLISFFSTTSAKRRARSRLDFERQARAALENCPDRRTLETEIAFIEHLQHRREWWDHAVELAWSVGGFVAFWLLGALIFSHTEGWPYGLGLYFCYIFFLTIGYGDVYVTTPAGRVIFVVYSLVAVPIMTSFAVQAIAGVFSKESERRLENRKESTKAKERKRRNKHRGDDEDDEPTEPELVSHAEYVQRHERKLRIGEGGAKEEKREQGKEEKKEEKHEGQEPHARDLHAEGGEEQVAEEEEEEDDHARVSLEASISAEYHAGDDEERRQEEQCPSKHEPEPTSADGNSDDKAHRVSAEEQRDQAQDSALTDRVLDAAASLERHARRLLINSLASGSRGQVLLKADWHVQLAEMRAVLHARQDADPDPGKGKRDASREGNQRKEEGEKEEETLQGKMKKRVEEEAELVLLPLTEDETMDEIRAYRECFAALLVAGSQLRKLKGHEQALFERRQIEDGKEDC